MLENERGLGSYIEQGQRNVLRAASHIGQQLVHAAQLMIDVGHEFFGDDPYDELKKAANINSENGCLTRKGMFNALDEMIKSEKPEELLVTYVDQIRFKSINDRFGQNTGDSALAVTGWGLREIFQTKDNQQTHALVGSWGGDEFICVLPGDASMNQTAFAESLDFKYEKGETSGEVTWHLEKFLRNIEDIGNSHYQESPIPNSIRKLVSKGVFEMSYRYTFDIVTVGQESRAKDIIDTFTERNTIKTATYLRKPR